MAALLMGRGLAAGCFSPSSSRSAAACPVDVHSRLRPCRMQPWAPVPRCPLISAAASSSAAADTPEPPEQDFQPFPRMREGNPYRLLGVQELASFEEVQEARNYLYQYYRWHEPSREAIELAFERILKEKYDSRQKQGFRPPRTGRRTDILSQPDRPSFMKNILSMVDDSISLTTLINEAFVYVALGLWALFSSDQSFPLAGAFAYSVYKFQNKRMKAFPEGPHLGGNPIIGALLTTGFNIGVACGLMAVLTAPLQSVLETSMRQVGACLVIVVAGVMGVYIK